MVSTLLLTGCGEVFDMTPYDVRPPAGLRGLTSEHLARIASAGVGAVGPVTIGFISDPHYHYGDLADVVSHMRADPSIDLVVVPGDLTDQGLLGEFEWFARTMGGLTVPWLAVIGNHDHLGNGRLVYEAMFGPRNFTMDLPGHRFIFFDDTVWESDMPPDLAWLDKALADAGERIPIVVAHIPPFTDQLEGVYEEPLRQRLADAGVPLFIHGHLHRYGQSEPYRDGVRYLGIPWPEDRSYVKLVVDGTELAVERVRL